MGGNLSALPAPPISSESGWHSSWLSSDHIRRYTPRRGLDDRNFIRLYETLNDVRILKERLSPAREYRFLEVGCATGDFYRYLALRFPWVRYHGVDLSPQAIEQANLSYPGGAFAVADCATEIAGVVRRAWGVAQADVVYASDVIHHQPQPLALLDLFIQSAQVAAIIRCRTKDRGETEWNPIFSRQSCYGRWVPYIVINLNELTGHIRRVAPEAELVVYRSRKLLASRYGRELPPDCSTKEAGTAETAVGIFFDSGSPGRVTLKDRPDNRPNTTWDHKLRSVKRRLTAWAHR
jgi:SAM-dependent methyltransferase